MSTIRTAQGTIKALRQTDRPRGEFNYYWEVVVVDGSLKTGRPFRIHRSQYHQPLGSLFSVEWI